MPKLFETIVLKQPESFIRSAPRDGDELRFIDLIVINPDVEMTVDESIVPGLRAAVHVATMNGLEFITRVGEIPTGNIETAGPQIYSYDRVRELFMRGRGHTLELSVNTIFSILSEIESLME